MLTILKVEQAGLADVLQLRTSLTDLGLLVASTTAGHPAEGGERALADLALPTVAILLLK